MISVIVPVYKVEKYLEKCLNSIQNQTYEDIEIILVDDGSPDNSGEICDKFAEEDSRIKVIHQNNRGQAVARNAALDIAKGKYIAFVDSDDTINPQMLEILIDLLRKNDSDLAICGYKTVYEEGSLDDVYENIFDEKIMNKEELWQEIFGKLNNAVWNKLYIASKIGKLRFPEGLIHGEDLIFNLKYLTKCEKGVITNIPLYNYLQRRDSVTGTCFSKNKLCEIDSKDRALHIIEKYAPEQLANAKKYCFRSRMNVIRAIYKAKKEKMYAQELKQYTAYVYKNFNMVKVNLKFKEKVEYWLLKYFKTLYITFVSNM